MTGDEAAQTEDERETGEPWEHPPRTQGALASGPTPGWGRGDHSEGMVPVPWGVGGQCQGGLGRERGQSPVIQRSLGRGGRVGGWLGKWKEGPVERVGWGPHA